MYLYQTELAELKLLEIEMFFAFKLCTYAKVNFL